MRLSASFFAATIAWSLASAGVATAQQIGPTIVVDAATGQVLQADRAGMPWLPASLTKMMTAYVALRQVREGRVTMNTGLPVSQRAARATPSKMGFRPGTVITIDNALKIIMVKSANDVSITIAEGLGGSVENFSAMMNAEARRLGMSGTRFINPNGLPGAGQQTTARDLAVLARALMREFPEHSALWRLPAIRYGNRVMRNHNHLIGRYPGADGFKTGFTCASGFNVVATATRGGRQLIVVVLGSTSARGRAETAAGMFERHFAGYGGSGAAVESIPNDVSSGPPDIREQACRRRGRGPAYIEQGEEMDAEPIATNVDPGNLSFAQMMAQPNRAGRPAGLQALAAASNGQVISLLGPYRPTSDPVPVFIGGATAIAAPASAPVAAPTLASVPRSAPAELPPGLAAPTPRTTTTMTTTGTSTVTVVPAHGAITRGSAGEPAQRLGAISGQAPAAATPVAAAPNPAGAPLSLQGAAPIPAARPAALRNSRTATSTPTPAPSRTQARNSRNATPVTATRARPRP